MQEWDSKESFTFSHVVGGFHSWAGLAWQCGLLGSPAIIFFFILPPFLSLFHEETDISLKGTVHPKVRCM